jgi:hypothetical protein
MIRSAVAANPIADEDTGDRASRASAWPDECIATEGIANRSHAGTLSRREAVVRNGSSRDEGSVRRLSGARRDSANQRAAPTRIGVSRDPGW